MKKITLLSFFILGTILSTQAQLKIGAKAGLNFANLDVEGSSPDNRTAIHFGAFAVVNFSDNLGFQPELLYSAKGAEQDGFELNTTYLDVPLLLRYNINDLISLHAGPQLSFLLSAEDADGTDIKDFYTGSDLALAFGAQLDLPAGLAAGARYNLGLSDVNDIDSPGAGEVKNNVFQIYVGWTLFGN